MLRDVGTWQLIVLCAVLLGVAANAQDSTLSATTVANNPGSAFVYVPSTKVEGAIAVRLLVDCQAFISLSLRRRRLSLREALSVNVVATTALQTGASSTTSLRTVTYWPALAGMGISQSAFTLAPCTVRSPHLHLRAAGLLYAYDGMQSLAEFLVARVECWLFKLVTPNHGSVDCCS